MDPLLKDLGERKQGFRRTISSLATELKDVRTRLASYQHISSQETHRRKEIEMKAMGMQQQITQLQKDLDHANSQLDASTSIIHKYVKELDSLRSLLSATQATADAYSMSAQSAQAKCLTLFKDLHEKDTSIKEHEHQLHSLGMQLNLLRAQLQHKEDTLNYSRDECYSVEQEPVIDCTGSKNFDMEKILEEVSPKSLDKIHFILAAKDEEIERLREGIRIMSQNWKLKKSNMELQIEKHEMNDQELKKRLMNVEFCLQEAHCQIRKLKRMGERKEKVLKELRDELVRKQQHGCAHNIWESCGFKFLLSISLLILIIFSKR